MAYRHQRVILLDYSPLNNQIGQFLPERKRVQAVFTLLHRPFTFPFFDIGGGCIQSKFFSGKQRNQLEQLDFTERRSVKLV